MLLILFYSYVNFIVILHYFSRDNIDIFKRHAILLMEANYLLLSQYTIIMTTSLFFDIFFAKRTCHYFYLFSTEIVKKDQAETFGI